MRIVNHHESASGVALIMVYDNRNVMTRIFKDDVCGFMLFIGNIIFTEWFLPMLTILRLGITENHARISIGSANCCLRIPELELSNIWMTKGGGGMHSPFYLPGKFPGHDDRIIRTLRFAYNTLYILEMIENEVIQK